MDDSANYEISSESPHSRRLLASPSSDRSLALNTPHKEPGHSHVLKAKVRLSILNLVTATRSPMRPVTGNQAGSEKALESSG